MKVQAMHQQLQRQICIPVISSMKRLEQFLLTPLTVCVLQDVHVSLLGSMLNRLHEQHRLGLVHLDMIHGLATDEYGAEFACQQLKADGLITTKTRPIETAKRNKKVAIQRFFLIDSKSIERGLETLAKSQPDFIEVMPAIAFNILPSLKARTSIPIIGGGLIKTIAEIDQGLQNGYSALTLSDLSLCMDYIKKHS